MTDISDDELRALLSRIDPAPAGVPVDPVTSPRAQELVERAMQTLDPPSARDEVALRRARRPLIMAVAAAAVLVAVVGGFLAFGSGDRPGQGGEGTTLALSLPPADAMASCMVFDVQFLADMPLALAGTVTAIESDQVILGVDRWYRGGTADRVTVAVPSQPTSAALDGVDFREGQRYLLTATAGTVNGCGFSGPATPELERAFDEAFPG